MHASASASAISPPATSETIPFILVAIETGTKTRTATAGRAPSGSAANGATTAATGSYAAFRAAPGIHPRGQPPTAATLLIRLLLGD